MKGKNAFLDLRTLLGLPCYIFWKNIDGIYQGYNAYGAMTLDFQRGNEFIGKSYREIYQKEHAVAY